MRLFIRCEWTPDSNSPLQSRIDEVIGELSNPSFVKLFGDKWYSLSESKARSLSNPLNLEALSRIPFWRKVSLDQYNSICSLDLWSGRAEHDGENLSLAIQIPPDSFDSFTISGIDATIFQSEGYSWPALLQLAETLGRSLGGCSRISSFELNELAPTCTDASSSEMAYATFWGIDRSRRNLRYKHLGRSKLPFSFIAADSWDEVNNPNVNRLRKLNQLLRE